MGVFSRFPYSNAHQLNLDWIVEEVKSIKDYVNSDSFQEDVDKAIREKAAHMFAQSAYVPETESILLSWQIIEVGPNASHIYDGSSEAIEIEE